MWWSRVTSNIYRSRSTVLPTDPSCFRLDPSLYEPVELGRGMRSPGVRLASLDRATLVLGPGGH